MATALDGVGACSTCESIGSRLRLRSPGGELHSAPDDRLVEKRVSRLIARARRMVFGTSGDVASLPQTVAPTGRGADGPCGDQRPAIPGAFAGTLAAEGLGVVFAEKGQLMRRLLIVVTTAGRYWVSPLRRVLLGRAG